MKTSSVSINDVTGHSIMTRQQNKAYEDNYEAIFGAKAEKKETRSEIAFTKTEAGKYLFEGENMAMPYLESLEKYPRTEFIWKEAR